MAKGVVKELVNIGERSDGSVIDVPVVRIKGNSKGRRLLVQAGAHGDEFTGVGAAMRLIKELEPQTLAGEVTIIPMLHTGAMDSIQRFSSFDGLDLASSYPGKPAGFLTERLAHWLIQTIVHSADAVIDLHTSEIWGEAYSYVNCAPAALSTGQKSLALAKAFGFPYLVQPKQIEANLLRSALAKYDIPSIGIELGGLGLCRSEQVDQVFDGVLNVLRYMRILPGEPVNSGKQTIIKEYGWIHAPAGGFLFNSCGNKKEIAKGEKIAEILDRFGEVKETIVAPYNAVVLIQRLCPLVKTGDQVILLGSLDGNSP